MGQVKLNRLLSATDLLDVGTIPPKKFAIAYYSSRISNYCCIRLLQIVLRKIKTIDSINNKKGR